MTDREAHAAAVRETWARKGEASRAAHAEAVSAGVTAAYVAAEAERELAKRAGTACPVCGRALGRTGMCWRSAECIDEGVSRVMPRYNPEALYVPRETGKRRKIT